MAVNIELLQKTLDTIKANPKHWDQRHWHCGSSHCFAGFAELLVRDLPINQPVNSEVFLSGETEQFATQQLGLNVDDADILFAYDNTLADLELFVKELCSHGTILSVPIR